MKERPILFSGPMVRAILEGGKTQTRRTIKDCFEFDYEDGWPMAPDEDGVWCKARCPCGQPGDLLWVREKFSTHVRIEDPYYLPPDYHDVAMGAWYWADGNPDHGDWTTPKPSIHMPRWASRLTLRIAELRVERLHDISETDAEAEGIKWNPRLDPVGPCKWASIVEPGKGFNSPKFAFQELWESINGPGSWVANPWVWVVSFERVDDTSSAGIA